LVEKVSDCIIEEMERIYMKTLFATMILFASLSVSASDAPRRPGETECKGAECCTIVNDSTGSTKAPQADTVDGDTSGTNR
jgi:hypothetical protein